MHTRIQPSTAYSPLDERMRLTDTADPLHTTRRGADKPSEVAPDRTGVVAIWAVVGLLVVTVAARTWTSWLLSDTEFRTVPILSPDTYPTWRLTVLRITEVLSVLEMS